MNTPALLLSVLLLASCDSAWTCDVCEPRERVPVQVVETALPGESYVEVVAECPPEAPRLVMGGCAVAWSSMTIMVDAPVVPQQSGEIVDPAEIGAWQCAASNADLELPPGVTAVVICE